MDARTPAALDFSVYRSPTSRLKVGGVDTAVHPTHVNLHGRPRHNVHSEFDGFGRAGPQNNGLLGACTNVIHLTRHVGTELHGIQLAQLTDKQKAELGSLIAERSVVFFRDQDISPQSLLLLEQQYRATEGHPQVARVPGVPGVTVIGPNFQVQDGRTPNFWQSGAPFRHPDFVYSDQPWGDIRPNDTVPDAVEFDRDIFRANYLTNDKLFTWTPGTIALWDNRVLRWMTQY